MKYTLVVNNKEIMTLTANTTVNPKLVYERVQQAINAYLYNDHFVSYRIIVQH